jgi:cell division protein FtsI/penicillin-binding protein 2
MNRYVPDMGYDHFSSWRVYQDRLKRARTLKERFRRTGKFLSFLTGVVLIFYLVFTGGSKVAGFFKDSGENPSAVFALAHENAGNQDSQEKRILDKEKVRSLLARHHAGDFTRKPLLVEEGGTKYQVESSIDPDLQDYVASTLDARNSRYIGIVVSEPETGRILAMGYLDKTDTANNPCVGSTFPAASVFKIITAAAGIESKHFNPDRVFEFNGGKYTLYKSQIQNKTSKHSNVITFKEAFANSVNPVFGRIGSLYLGKSGLENYAKAFGFNETLEMEIPLQPSVMQVSDDTFQWAEVASGYNKKTLITPVHGALIAGAVINGGILMEPTVIDRIRLEDGQNVYEGRKKNVRQAISSASARTLQQLMNATVSSGTCRKSFAGYTRDKVLSRLTIGGKTGSIDNETHDVRFDWFVGYASNKQGGEKIAVSIVVAHHKFIGTKASQYARLIMKYYFNRVFEQRKPFPGTNT